MLSRSVTALSLSLVATLAACGGAPPAPATPTGAEAGEHRHHDHDGKGKEEHDGKGKEHDDSAQPAPVRAFHEALAPLWHADKGPERVTKTCAQAPALKAKADATSNAELVAATAALVAECDKAGRPDFEARFAAVHERFHALAKHAEH
jgi:hypothetical protein